MGLREIRWGSVDWIGLAQDREKWGSLVNAVMFHKELGNYRVTSQLAQLHRVS
jgi:hypothetical protein